MCVCVLWQVIRTLPPSLLELPLSLLGRLLLCDPERSVPCLQGAAGSCGFFSPAPRHSRLAPSTDQALGSTEVRTTNSLLSALLQSDVLCGSAVEFLTLLSQASHCSPGSAFLPLYLEPTVLRQALAHSDDRVRAAACRLLGNLDPFMYTTQPKLQPGVFKDMIDRLHDPYTPVRRMACRAVGNWLGYIGQAGFTTGRSDGKGSTTTTGWGTEKGKDKRVCSQVGARVDSVSQEDGMRWVEEAKITAAPLVSLMTDPDALTRRHCCAALGNLASVYDGGGSSLLSAEGDVSHVLLTAACADSHHAVRRAAIATLRSLSQQVAI